MAVTQEESYGRNNDCTVDTIDDLIGELTKIREQHGNLPVGTYETDPPLSLYVNDWSAVKHVSFGG